MTKLIPAGASRRMISALVFGTALSAACGAQASQPEPKAVQDISRYCQVCWKNARLDPDRWTDCTQEVFVRLLQTVQPDRWTTLLKQDENDDRREFLRTIDAVKKRTQRAHKYAGLVDDVADRRNLPASQSQEQREQVQRAGRMVLTNRQQRIVELTFDGWSIPEIAEELRTSVERVSDEKYKAIRKLKNQLHISA
jgi:RNA polymerase sigma factor (sigma-70 family)